jgi:hypothetical protein
VYVQHEDPSGEPFYYPAGVYVGRVGNASAVRVIDSEVVNLINLAAKDGVVGREHPDEGPPTLNVPPLPGIPIAHLRVEVSPECAANAGAKWWAEGYPNQRFSPGELVGAVASTYTIRLTQVSGYVAPSRTVTLTAGQTNSISVVYRPVGGAWLKVDLGPQAAVLAGARWFLVEEPTNRWVSSQMINRAPCNYTVDFLPLAGFDTPAPRPVTLVYGRTNTITASYTPISVSLWLTMENGLFIFGPSGASWRVEINNELLKPSAWSNFTTIRLNNSVQLIPNTVPTNTGSRFYRAVQAP